MRTCGKVGYPDASRKKKRGPSEQRGANSPSKAIRNIFEEGHSESCAVTGVTVFGEEREREVNARFLPHHPL